MMGNNGKKVGYFEPLLADRKEQQFNGVSKMSSRPQFFAKLRILFENACDVLPIMTTAIFSHPDCKRHEMGSWHPECPERLEAIEDQLIAGRVDSCIEHREAPAAAIQDIARIHDAAAIAMVRDHIPSPAPQGQNSSSCTPAHAGYYPIDADTILNEYSWKAALRAAGAAVAATDAVIAGEIDNAFCAIRPPGHHARPSGAMGFCLFNNVAIAARHALDVHGLQRVAIIDFDVHHGNGTEEAFADDPRVLMVSFFQHPFYPYSGADSTSRRHENMVNVPVPAYTGGAAVRELVRDKWMPALHAHRPEMIFISAGFDAHREDDLGQMGLVEADYAWITAQIMVVAEQYSKGRIVSCLEGGYNLSALGRSVLAHLKVLAGLD
ncbi:MAG: histone deacetylase family protein [Herminiimonas sp.]|nr:histone deacetylase family protein [Herminiimonas sp.]